MDFNGKVAVVTGAGRGIGKVIAKQLGEKGATLVIISEADEIFDTREEFISSGLKVDAFKVDITNGQAVEEMFDKVIATHGKVDILINNAGITKDGLMLRMSEKDWDIVLDVNLKGAFFCCKYASKFMLKQRTGKIVNISSVVGVMGNAGQVNYSASKAGLIGLTKSVAKELASRGINCNAVAPGFIQTKMTDNLTENVKENYLNNIPLKRFGTPEEVADVVTFLVSEQSSYITGQILHIDGGLVM